MLRHRLISAFIIISGSLVCVALDASWNIAGCKGLWMTGLAIYLLLGSAIECTGLLSQHSIRFPSMPSLIGCCGIMSASMVPMLWPISGQEYPNDCLLGQLGWPLTAAVFAMLGCFVWFMRSYQAQTNDLLKAMVSGWVGVYFGTCFAFWVALRLVGESRWGLTLVVGMIVITKFSDSGAYFAGKSCGRTKLCPMVSPGKTIEGLVGGCVTAILAAVVYFQWFAGWLFGYDRVSVSWVDCAIMGIGLTCAGLIGDLSQSMVKREVGAKDSGRLLPGLGGLWDVTDSLLPAGVVGYLFAVGGLVIGPGQ